MLSCGQKAAIKEPGNVGRRDRTIRDAAVRGLDFDHRFQPEHPARSVAHQAQIDLASGRLGHDRVGDSART